MTIFNIPDLPKTVSLAKKTQNGQTSYTGAVTFTVSNATDQGIAGRFSVEPQGGAKPEWFSIERPERDIVATGTDTFTVALNLPGNAPPGKYAFDILGVNSADPDNLYTRSAVVAFEIAAPPPKPATTIPWWVWLIVGGVVLLILGVVLAIVLWPSSTVAVPGVVGETFAQAQTDIQAAGLVAAQQDSPGGGTVGNVIAQNPAKDAQIAKGATVNLTVATQAPVTTVTVPDVRGLSPSAAAQQLTAAGLLPPSPTSAPANATIVDTDPAHGQTALKGASVTWNLNVAAPPPPAAIAEDCIGFNPATAHSVQIGADWKFVDGSNWISDFGSGATAASEAQLQDKIVHAYNFNQVCYVARPNPPMTYWKSGNTIPSNTLGFVEEDCLAFNTDHVQIGIYSGDWKMVADNDAMLDFGANQAAAQQALAIVQHYRLSRQCFVGRPGPSMTYWLSQP